MSYEQKQLAIRLALADIGYLVRDNNGRVIVPPKTRSDRVELSLLQSRNIVRLHDDFSLYIEGIAATNKWYSSANQGTSWTTEATSSDKATFYTSGNSILGGGTSNIELSLDGSTFEDKTGNLANVVSSIGTIKRVFAL